MIYSTIMGIRFQIDRLHMVGWLTLIIYKTNIFIMISMIMIQLYGIQYSSTSIHLYIYSNKLNTFTFPQNLFLLLEKNSIYSVFLSFIVSENRQVCQICVYTINLDSYWIRENLLTYKSNDQNSEENPEGVTEDVHQDDGDESDGEVELTPPLLILTATEDLNTNCVFSENWLIGKLFL